VAVDAQPVACAAVPNSAVRTPGTGKDLGTVDIVAAV
jgi:hypothetical protein